jgi:hypothetical protein
MLFIKHTKYNIQTYAMFFNALTRKSIPTFQDLLKDCDDKHDDQQMVDG